ncbi:MAG: NAD-dependent epimerase/dehydratase family protein [Saprospiraceae bacterium]|nr:NAD-dependent epimerase/dehydratase family protein [Saprospiraceae bacterium]
MSSPLHVIITGATGMVGEGVLHTCLEHPQVASVLIINRKSLGLSHPKLTEVLHADFYDLSAIENQLKGYNACFFCLGVSSVGMKEADYFKVTYTLTMHVAEMLARLNPDMVFCYVSGQGTDSTEKGRSMWARVKGKTENDLQKLPFSRVYAYRPGFIKPITGLSKTHSFYKYVNWLYPLGRVLYPNGFNTLREVSLSMIYVAGHPYSERILNGKEIAATAKEA